MRKITQYEKDSIVKSYDSTGLPTQAVTMEFWYLERATGIPTKSFFWEDMLFPAEYIALGSGFGNLKVHKNYIEGSSFFSNPDSPSVEVTGKSYNFLELAQDTIYWNSESDVISGYETRYSQTRNKPTVYPGHTWAVKVKNYSFDGDGAIISIGYNVLQEVVAFGTDPTFGVGLVLVEQIGDYYYFALSDYTRGGNPVAHDAGSVPPKTPAESSLPESDGGKKVNLLSNAAEAKAYIDKVTVGVGSGDTTNAVEDRQRARVNLAEALWG